MKVKRSVLYYLFLPIICLADVLFREPGRDDELYESGVPQGLFRLGFRLDGDKLVMPKNAEGYYSRTIGETMVVTDRRGRQWDIPGAKIMVPSH
jgi:hypothetical protein